MPDRPKCTRTPEGDAVFRRTFLARVPESERPTVARFGDFLDTLVCELAWPEESPRPWIAGQYAALADDLEDLAAFALSLAEAPAPLAVQCPALGWAERLAGLAVQARHCVAVTWGSDA